MWFVSPWEEALEMDPFWLPSGAGPGQVSTERPLMERLWANPAYAQRYRCLLLAMLTQGFDEATFSARVDELADLIRDDVAADVNAMYSLAEFHARDVPGVTATAAIALEAGATRGFTDLVGELFGRSGVGTVVLTSGGGELMACDREYSILYDDAGTLTGTAGQLMRGLTEADLLVGGHRYHLLDLRQDRSGRRSHVAAFNPGVVPVELELDLYDGASGDWEGRTTVTVAARTLRQVNRIVEVIAPSQDGQPKRLEVTASAPVYLPAFRVNGDDDPVTIEALR